jgi:hypothetical protein
MAPNLQERLRTVAVMQPYIFPYLGYFQLIAKSDVFVFYDDVSFIKGGWIHSNRILAPNNGVQRFSVSLEGGQSSSRSIVDTPLSPKRDWQRKFTRTLRETYARAPHVERICGLVDGVLAHSSDSIADLACLSVRMVCEYIGLNPRFERSSNFAPETSSLDRTNRLITLTHRLQGECYVNLEGGRALYKPQPFKLAGLELRFLATEVPPYPQGLTNDFVPGLSVIDTLMWNQPEAVLRMASKGKIAT